MTGYHPLYRLYVVGLPILAIVEAYDIVSVDPLLLWALLAGWFALVMLGLRQSAAQVRRKKMECDST